MRFKWAVKTMEDQMPLADRYLPDAQYDDLVEALTAAATGDDPHHPGDRYSAVQTILGERLGVWPEEIREDVDKAA